MTRHLIVAVRLHEARFHGTPEWPPGPARLFQALAAGAAQGARIPEQAQRALMWLERLPPPVVWAPKAKLGTRVDLFVPNNDLDAEGGNPANIGNIRTKKFVLPRLLDGAAEFGYAWEIGNDSTHARDIPELAESLYQFGRGVDFAWAEAKLVDGELSELLESQRGDVFRPTPSGTAEVELPCPAPGSLVSLVDRYEANRQRLREEGSGKAARVLFTQPPKARFAQIGYEAAGRRVLYDLRQGAHESKLFPWPLERSGELVERLRDAAAERLKTALPAKADQVESFVVGRKVDGADAARPADRIQIIPVGSIGSEYADLSIRRVVVEVPSSCPLGSADVHWAFSGLDPVEPDTGEVPFLLTESTEFSMLKHYVPERGARRWRSITAVALPTIAGRRRMDRGSRGVSAKGGAERLVEESRAIAAVRTALRHAGVHGHALTVRVQREPFDARGTHAEAFASGTRFSKHQLWHVEVTFSDRLTGPFVLGDGRFLGLGVMAPVERHEGIYVYQVEAGLAATADAQEITRSLRRAVMARVQANLGSRGRLSTYFTGHESDGTPAHTAEHLTFASDPVRGRLFIFAPHVVNRRPLRGKSEAENLGHLEAALVGFRELRAGAAGLLKLGPLPSTPQQDPLLAPARSWESVTPYQVNRHAKKLSAADALAEDLRAECRRRGLPDVRVTPVDPHGIPGVGLAGHARLDFEVAVEGPLILGKNRHFGGGLFQRTNT